ncbi:hypothetical protein [Borrelia sp. RT5S]|uniref:hypothetical protein n=1 Tax=Borrelia sp. RT5S TaxID=2898581 RepID=UPI001E484D0D|nr:hypothetical protein [Borrelia sp. RT5S]UGQ16802.1 hypothetical protein LSO06_05625 [Borrelia sp. RT5S]
MKKINTIVFLMLLLALMACNIDLTGKGGAASDDEKDLGEENLGQQLGAGLVALGRQLGVRIGDEAADGPKTGEEKKVELKTVDTVGGSSPVRQPGTVEVKTAEEVAFDGLKTKRDNYKNKMAKLKADFEASSSQNKVEIPSQEKDLTIEDQARIHSSLDYNNGIIKDLDESIKALGLVDIGKQKEVDMVSEILHTLAAFDDTTKDVLDIYLKNETLETVKNDKDKLDKLTAELDKFMSARDGFIREVQDIVKRAVSSKSDHAQLKKELGKINEVSTTESIGKHRRAMLEAPLDIKVLLGLVGIR